MTIWTPVFVFVVSNHFPYSDSQTDPSTSLRTGFGNQNIKDSMTLKSSLFCVAILTIEHMFYYNKVRF